VILWIESLKANSIHIPLNHHFRRIIFHRLHRFLAWTMANIVKVAVPVPKMVPRYPKSNFHNAVIFFGPSMVKEPEGEVFVPERSPAQQSNDCSVQKSAEESTEYVYSYHCSYYIIVTTL